MAQQGLWPHTSRPFSWCRLLIQASIRTSSLRIKIWGLNTCRIGHKHKIAPNWPRARSFKASPRPHRPSGDSKPMAHYTIRAKRGRSLSILASVSALPDEIIFQSNIILFDLKEVSININKFTNFCCHWCMGFGSWQLISSLRFRFCGPSHQNVQAALPRMRDPLHVYSFARLSTLQIFRKVMSVCSE
jgi:hypothetical protein